VASAEVPAAPPHEPQPRPFDIFQTNSPQNLTSSAYKIQKIAETKSAKISTMFTSSETNKAHNFTSFETN
jgi:hypothetical protein